MDSSAYGASVSNVRVGSMDVAYLTTFIVVALTPELKSVKNPPEPVASSAWAVEIVTDPGLGDA